jgi:hypothetical protein
LKPAPSLSKACALRGASQAAGPESQFTETQARKEETKRGSNHRNTRFRETADSALSTISPTLLLSAKPLISQRERFVSFRWGSAAPRRRRNDRAQLAVGLEPLFRMHEIEIAPQKLRERALNPHEIIGARKLVRGTRRAACPIRVKSRPERIFASWLTKPFECRRRTSPNY